MYAELDEKNLLAAYEGRTDLQSAIRNAAAGPQYVELFNYISAHIVSLISSHSPNYLVSKKRKNEEGQLVETSRSANVEGQQTLTTESGNENILLKVDGISFILPQRRKFTLCFTDQHLFAQSHDGQIVGTRMAWKDIEYSFLLPMPEKTQAQHGFIFFPYNSCFDSAKKSTKVTDVTLPLAEPIVFTVTTTIAPKLNTISGSLSQQASAVGDDYVTLLSWALKFCFKAAGISTEIISTDEKLFSSAQKQSHRLGEKTVWIKAFRGSKEGYLFFLPCGILWAFKKPLLFLSHSNISSISFTSVLSRTFNLSIEILTDNTAGEFNEVEFTMLDQEDFENIKRYVNRYGLQDRSMTEKRRAKALNINPTRGENRGMINKNVSELAKADLADEMVSEDLGNENLDNLDDEDDEGEDYDPGSEGESEGSGSSSEEESIGRENNETDAKDELIVNGLNH